MLDIVRLTKYLCNLATEFEYLIKVFLERKGEGQSLSLLLSGYFLDIIDVSSCIDQGPIKFSLLALIC